MKILFTILLLVFPFCVSATNYNDDANCMGSWDLEAAAGSGETDLSGEGGDLSEDGGNVDRVADPGSPLGSYSRGDFHDDTCALKHADNNSTDINGADQHISVVVWEKSETGWQVEAITAKYHAAAEKRQYSIATSESVGRMILSSDGNSYSICQGNDNVVDMSWHHIAGVYNDTDIRLYVDGVLDEAGTDNPKTYSAGIHASVAPFHVGCQGNTGQLFNWDGLIDEPAVFNDALDSTEINEIIDYGMAGSTPRRVIITKSWW